MRDRLISKTDCSVPERLPSPTLTCNIGQRFDQGLKRKCPNYVRTCVVVTSRANELARLHMWWKSNDHTFPKTQVVLSEPASYTPSSHEMTSEEGGRKLMARNIEQHLNSVRAIIPRASSVDQFRLRQLCRQVVGTSGQ